MRYSRPAASWGEGDEPVGAVAPSPDAVQDGGRQGGEGRTVAPPRQHLAAREVAPEVDRRVPDATSSHTRGGEDGRTIVIAPVRLEPGRGTSACVLFSLLREDRGDATRA
jgi:hypothetical protein